VQLKHLVGAAFVAFLGFAALPPSLDPEGSRVGEPIPALPADSAAHHLLLIGDTGAPDPTGEPVLNLLRTYALRYGEQSTAVFLGDNLYPYGLPAPDHPEYPEARRRLVQQLDSLAGYAGRVRFVPGNHDWGHGIPGGAERAERQAELVESFFPGAFPLRPSASPIHLDTLLPGVVLMSLDTAWWLYEDAVPTPARADSMQTFARTVADTLAARAHQTVVVAAHHPMYTNSVHGGLFPLRSHVYPLTELAPWAYLPLPVLGTLALELAKRRGLTVQDLGHPRYRALRAALLPPVEGHPRTVFASGHEHTLQHFDKAAAQGTHYVISGAGCEAKQDPVVGGGELDWGLGSPGIAHVRFYPSGEAWMDFVTPRSAVGESVGAGVLRYRARLF
jgi:hypothetical protein